MKIKAICSDIDGTLLDSRRELSARTIDVFRKIPTSIPVILASSRMPSAMVHLQKDLGILVHPLICYNGGYSISLNHAKTIYTTISIPVPVCERILEMTQTTGIHVSLFHEDFWYAPAVDHWTDREQRITKVNAIIEAGNTVLSRWKSENKGAHKVMCMGDENEIAVLGMSLQKELSDQIHIYRSRSTYLELAPKAISKATALEQVLSRQFGISMRDVLAFGDNYNDVDLIASAGIGIAVSNAREEVKRVAKEITRASIEDGVATAVEKYLPYF